MVSIQVLATPIIGRARSSSVKPIPLSMARAPARSRPSVIIRLRCLGLGLGVMVTSTSYLLFCWMHYRHPHHENSEAYRRNKRQVHSKVIGNVFHYLKFSTIQFYPFMVYLFIGSSGYTLYCLPEYQAERYISISALASSRSAFSKCVPSIFFRIMKGRGEFYASKTHHRTTARNRTNLRPTSQRRRPRVIYRFNGCRSCVISTNGPAYPT